MKVLFVGGSGIISSGCVEVALERNWDVYILNRGSQKEQLPGVTYLKADINDTDVTEKLLGTLKFDAVIDFICFTLKDMERDLSLFKDRTSHYIFISSASAYLAPFSVFPITENAPLGNPIWQYSRDKIDCETLLQDAVKNSGFPGTIVRPSHTYGKTYIPLEGGYTVLHRMLQGLPIVVHGDGSSLWALTHHRDFAVGLLGLLGKKESIGESYHITTDELLSWDQIHMIFAEILKVQPKIVHIPSDIIAKYNKEWGDSLLGDKAYSVIFDNSKIKKIVPEFTPKIPFSEGAREIMDWHQSHPEMQVTDPHWDLAVDKLIRDWEKFNATLP